MSNGPLLSSISAFVLIGIAFAMAAYLRQAVENREKLLDEIENGRVPKFRPGTPQTIAKVRHLNTSRRRLNAVAPVLIWLSIFVIARMVFLAGFKLPNAQVPAWLDHTFRWFDFVLMICLLVLYIVLWYMHHASLAKDREIRAIAEGYKAGLEGKPDRPPLSEALPEQAEPVPASGRDGAATL